jgi:aryl carrier-like protein
MSIRDADIDAVDVASWDEFDEVVGKLEAGEGEWGKFESVVIDSLTEIQQLLHENIIDERDKGDSDAMEIADWGKSAIRMMRIIRRLKNLGIHIIITCLETEDRDEKTKKLRCFPAVQGRLASLLPGIPDILGFMYTAENPNDPEKPGRYMLVMNDGKHLAKDRTDNLGMVVVEPTVQQCIDAIAKKRHEAKPEEKKGK